MKAITSAYLAARLKKGMLSELFRPKGGLVTQIAPFSSNGSKRKLAFFTSGCLGSMSKPQKFLNPNDLATSIKEPVPAAGSKNGCERLT
jgi:hypothetical protein